jgi:hypothetical protein
MAHLPVVKLAARLNLDRAGQQVARTQDVALAHPAGPVLLDCLAEDTDWCRSSATIDRRTSGGYTLTQSVLNFLRRFVHWGTEPRFKAIWPGSADIRSDDGSSKLTSR